MYSQSIVMTSCGIWCSRNVHSGLYTYYDYHEAMVLEVDMLISYTTVK